MSAPTSQGNLPSKPHLRRIRRLIGVLLTILILLVLAALMILNFWFVPRINQYTNQMAQTISQRIGIPVSIGQLHAQRNGLLPEVTISDFRINTPDGAQGLHIANIHAAISIQALLHGNIEFSEFTVIAPQIYAQRDSNNHLWVAGLNISELSSPPKTQEASLDGQIPWVLTWLISQPKISIHQGQILWTDHITAAPPLTLNDVEITLETNERSHQIQIQATPPTDWGDRFTLRTELLAPENADTHYFQNWDASAYALFPLVDVQQLPRHIQLPIQIVQGRGFVEVQGEYKHGQLIASTATLNLPAVEIQASPERASIHLQNFKGKLTGSWQADVYHIQTNNLTFSHAPQTTIEGEYLPEQIWPETAIDISWKFDNQGQINGGIIKTGNVSLVVLSRLAQGLPLPEAVQNVLTEINPQGRIEFLDIFWQGAPSAPQAYTFTGKIRDLTATSGTALPPTPPKKIRLGRPGVEHLNLSFSINEKSGHAQIDMENGSVSLSGLFEEPQVPIKSLHAQIDMENLGDGRFNIHAPNVEVDVEDAQLQLQASWTSPATNTETDRAGYLTLNGKLLNANIQRVYRYLPLSIQPKVRNYLKEGLILGFVPIATVKIEGPLVDFPYHRTDNGIFLIQGQAQDVTLNFAPRVVLKSEQTSWPTLNHIYGDMQVTGKGMSIQNAKGQILNVPSSHFEVKEVTIPDWGKHDTHVLVETRISGDANPLLQTIKQSALGVDILKGMLSTAWANGKLSVQLNLDIAIDNMPNSKATGHIQLQNNTLRLWPFVPELKNTQGHLTFTEKGFTASQVQAQTLGGVVKGNINWGLTQGLHAKLTGTLTAQGLFNDPHWGKLLLPQWQWLEGKTTYTFDAHYKNNQQVMRFESDLVGLALNLPEPLLKPAQTAYPLQITLTPLVQGNRFLPLSLQAHTRASKNQLPQISANYILSETPLGVAPTQGTIGVNTSPLMPITGTTAYIKLEHLNIPSWNTFLGAHPTTGQKNSAPPPIDLTLPIWWPQYTHAQIAKFRIGEQFTATNATLEVQRQASNWGAKITAQEIIGDLQWQAPLSKKSTGVLHARFSRLWLPQPASPQENEYKNFQTQATQQAPFRLLPHTQLHVDHLRFGKMELGSLDLLGKVDSTIVPARWLIEQFDLTTPHSELKAQGFWADTPTPTTSLQLTLKSKNAGLLLTQLGFSQTLAQAPGAVTGQVSWQAPPHEFSIQRLSGQLTLTLGKGQVLFASPGASRLLSLLSLQALPSRLALDFRDISREGLAFDHIHGNLTIRNGILNLRALDLEGVSVSVLTSGTLDLMQHTQYLKTIIIPKIDVGAASVALTAVNPVVGLSSLVLQFALQSPMSKITTRTYYITGTWEAPEISQMRPTISYDQKTEQKTPYPSKFNP